MVFLRIVIYLLIFIVITDNGFNPYEDCVVVCAAHTYI